MPVPFFSGAKQLTIDLAEPVIILRGQSDNSVTHVLQGEVNIVLTKPITVSKVMIQFAGKSFMLWPEGIGPRKSKLHNEKTIHEQNIILQAFNDVEGGILQPGLHRWPFEFLLSNRLVETIEDEMAKVFYYVTATIHRVGMGAVKLRCRRDILLLRTPNWSNSALTANSLPTTSIVSERRLPTCDVAICVEKSHVSSGTHLPIFFSLTPNMKHVYIESISVIINERKAYRLPEFQARRNESYDYKISLLSSDNHTDPAFESAHDRSSQLSLKDMRRALSVKNAHIPLNGGCFQHRLMFELPNCLQLNHDTTFSEISIHHRLKITIELSSPSSDSNGTAVVDRPVRSNIRLDTPITILDCRLKEDYAILPTYEEAVLCDSIIDDTDLSVDKQTGFFLCPCYLEFKKRTEGSRKEWSKIRNDLHVNAPSGDSIHRQSYDSLTLPPSYDSIETRR